jgi:hypothetical protein
MESTDAELGFFFLKFVLMHVSDHWLILCSTSILINANNSLSIRLYPLM